MDNIVESAKMSFPRLTPEIESLCTTESAIDLVYDLLMKQHAVCYI